MRIYKDVVMIQGKGAWGVIQIGSFALCFGNDDNGPSWHLSLFRPYSKNRLQFHRRAK